MLQVILSTSLLSKIFVVVVLVVVMLVVLASLFYLAKSSLFSVYIEVVTNRLHMDGMYTCLCASYLPM